MLDERGIPYELTALTLKKNEHKKPDYLAVNPLGKVPAIVHDGVAITEAAAICTYLADAFPQAGLAIPVGDQRRGPYLKWLFFGPSCLEPAAVDRIFKRPAVNPSSTGWGDFDQMLDLVAKAVTPGPYLFGEKFTAADVVIGSQMQWGTMTKAIPERADIGAYIKTLMARPALQRVYAKDAELVAAQEKAG
jgi:glutathione S-transferase